MFRLIKLQSKLFFFFWKFVPFHAYIANIHLYVLNVLFLCWLLLDYIEKCCTMVLFLIFYWFSDRRPSPFAFPFLGSQKSGNAVLGLPYALASISFCQSFNLDLLKASATLTLAELWLGLGSNHTKRALDLLHGAFPMILGHGGLELRARAYIFEANCYLSDPSSSGSFCVLYCFDEDVQNIIE